MMLKTRRQDSHQQLAAPYLQHDTVLSLQPSNKALPAGYPAERSLLTRYPKVTLTHLFTASEHNSKPKPAGVAYRRDPLQIPTFGQLVLGLGDDKGHVLRSILQDLQRCVVADAFQTRAVYGYEAVSCTTGAVQIQSNTYIFTHQ